MKIHFHIYNPADSIFKTKKTDHAEYQAVECSLETCPLREKGQCAAIAVIFAKHCPYGKYSRVLGPTRKSKQFYPWIIAQKEAFKGVPYLKNAVTKMAFIGEYVYLPYAHMDMNKSVPFLDHSVAFSSGEPFIKIEDWTIENILKIIDFRPQALYCGEITDYQAQSVPEFIAHLREDDPAMFAKLVAVRPQYDTVPNYVGRKAYLYTLNAPLAWTVKNPKYGNGYAVSWKWDGQKLVTSSPNVYTATWGGDIKMDSFEMIGTPDKNTVVVVQDNSWVNSNTRFQD